MEGLFAEFLLGLMGLEPWVGEDLVDRDTFVLWLEDFLQ